MYEKVSYIYAKIGRKSDNCLCLIRIGTVISVNSECMCFSELMPSCGSLSIFQYSVRLVVLADEALHLFFGIFRSTQRCIKLSHFGAFLAPSECSSSSLLLSETQ